MANRRMFSLDVTDTDKFLDLPHDAQLLYYHLGMRADDDGFIGVAKRLCRLVDIDENNLETLVKENFLYKFDDGVYAIVHWKLNNYIRQDRYKKTIYTENYDEIYNKSPLDTNGIPVVDHLETQDRLGKNSIDKDSIGEGKGREENESAPPAPETENNSYNTYGEYLNVRLTNQELDALAQEYPREYKEYIEKLSSYIASTGKEYNSHFATIKRWLAEDNKKSKTPVKNKNLNNYNDTNFTDFSALEEELLDSFLDDDTA